MVSKSNEIKELVVSHSETWTAKACITNAQMLTVLMETKTCHKLEEKEYWIQGLKRLDVKFGGKLSGASTESSKTKWANCEWMNALGCWQYFDGKLCKYKGGHSNDIRDLKKLHKKHVGGDVEETTVAAGASECETKVARNFDDLQYPGSDDEAAEDTAVATHDEAAEDTAVAPHAQATLDKHLVRVAFPSALRVAEEEPMAVALEQSSCSQVEGLALEMVNLISDSEIELEAAMQEEASASAATATATAATTVVPNFVRESMAQSAWLGQPTVDCKTRSSVF